MNALTFVKSEKNKALMQRFCSQHLMESSSASLWVSLLTQQQWVQIEELVSNQAGGG